MAALFAFPAPSHAGGPQPDSAAFVVPDFGRVFGTWLWIKTEGVVAATSPETKGARRRLVLKPDFTYEFHHRVGTRDSVLCRGLYSMSEQSSAGGDAILLVEFENWFEKYERIMLVDFETADTLHLAGTPCANCPEHTFVRGRSVTIDGEAKRGEPFHAYLWDGLEFELVPTELGWEIAVRDTTRPDENLARLTPPIPGAANPRLIEGPAFSADVARGQDGADAPWRKREFIFSPDVGLSIQGPGSDQAPTDEEIERVGEVGRGVLMVGSLEIGSSAARAAPGGMGWIESMRFTVSVEQAVRGARQSTR